jgi:SAM-dependent methyltransferase
MQSPDPGDIRCSRRTNPGASVFGRGPDESEKTPPPQQRFVLENISRHNTVAGEYDACHPEIFNPTEQERLERELDRAVAYIQTSHGRSLDYGCGSGNLTGKLLLRGLEVHAADVSPGMLRVVQEKHRVHVDSGVLRTVQLPLGFPLPFPDRHFAFVGAYSVLHHVPDYLQAVQELVRVLDRGGVLYIDHEHNEGHWRSPVGVRIHRLLTMPGYSIRRLLAWLVVLFGKTEQPLLPPLQREITGEGDIHIYADDHIDWAAIRHIGAGGGLVQVPTKDYLLCREMSRFPIRHWLCRHFAEDMGIYIGCRPV